MCVKRENIIPAANAREKAHKKYVQIVTQARKQETGQILTRGTGMEKLISCADKNPECGYPDNRNYWCKTCVNKVGQKYKPVANALREQQVAQAKILAEAKAKAKAVPKRKEAAKAKSKPKAKSSASA